MFQCFRSPSSMSDSTMMYMPASPHTNNNNNFPNSPHSNNNNNFPDLYSNSSRPPSSPAGRKARGEGGEWPIPSPGASVCSLSPAHPMVMSPASTVSTGSPRPGTFSYFFFSNIFSIKYHSFQNSYLAIDAFRTV